jgi:hypothetical protein
MRVWLGLPVLFVAWALSFVSLSVAARLRLVACRIAGKAIEP